MSRLGRRLSVRVPAAALVAALAAGGCGSGPSPPSAQPAPAERGRRLAGQEGCLSCHSPTGERMTGPTWKGLYGSRVDLEDGTTVIADDAYLTESIRDPDAKTVRGFPKGVMAAVIRPGSLSERDVEALAAYIKTLR